MVKYPEDWKVVPLGEVARLQNGYAFKSETYHKDGAYTVVTIANVQDGRFDCEDANRIAVLPRDLQSHQQLKIGDVLVSMTGNVGRVCRVDLTGCLLNQRVGKFDIRGADIDYVYTVLRGNDFLSKMIEKGQGGAQPNIGKGDIESYSLPLPPLPEQKRIAAVLGSVDKLIDNLSRRIEKKRLVKQGVMQDLLTAKKRLPGFSGEWKRVKFGDCFELRRNNTCSRSLMAEIGGKIRNIHYGDILVRYGAIAYCDKEPIPCLTELGEKLACDDYVQNGDVVIADTAEDEAAGKAVEIRGVADMKVVSGLHTLLCRPRFEFAEGWLGHWMNSPMYHKQLLPLMTGIKVLSLSRASFMKTSVIVPTLLEQKVIAGVLGAMDGEIAKLEAKLEKYRSLKQGLMNDLLTGRVRLAVSC